MKKFATYPLIALTCLHVYAGTLPAQTRRNRPTPAVELNDSAWQTFVAPEAGFTVRLPGSPEKRGQVLKTGVGSLPAFSFELKTEMAEYLISYMDFPSAFDDNAALKLAYDFGRDETIAINQLTLVGDREISINGNAGRQITAARRGQLLNNRIVAVDKRLYQVSIVTRDYRKFPPARIKFFESTINRFLDSFTLIASVIGQGATSTEETVAIRSIDLGRVENSVYINDDLGFRTSLPQSWSLVERETIDAALQVGKEMSRGPDSQINTRLEQSLAKTSVLFTTSKFPLRTANATQAILQCGVEELSEKSMTARVYLERNRDFLVGSPLKAKLIRDIYPVMIGGLSFFVMDVQQTSAGVTINQKYYATKRKGHALFFVTNYFDDADGIALENIIQSTKFE